VVLPVMLFACLRLWSIGVGSVIGGDFFGWNSTLEGGFGACLLAVLINALMFGILAHCTTGLSSRIPKGGAYSYVTHGIGPKSGLLVAALELIKLFWVLSALCFGLTDYIRSLLHFTSPQLQFLCYPLLFIFFASLGLLGIKTSGNIQIVITCGCLLVLSFYWCSVSTLFDFTAHATPDDDWFKSWRAILISLPYGSWLFLGFEELPLIQIDEVEDPPPPPLTSHTMDLAVSLPAHTALSSPLTPSSPSTTSTSPDKSKIMFYGIVTSFLTVCLSGSLTVTLASASRPGVDLLKDKSSPLLSGIEEVYGEEHPVTVLFNVLSILALFAPCYSFMLYCSEHIQVRLLILLLLSFTHSLFPSLTSLSVCFSTSPLLIFFQSKTALPLTSPSICRSQILALHPT
jgi:amino acid transporter